MNERIIELRKQCITEVKDQHGNWINYHFDENKFAELIIRECMRMCEVAEVGLLTHGLREQSYGASNVKQYIIDWFGIEE